MIKSSLWSDDWFTEIKVDEKLIWIYLLSNDQSNIAGIYKTTPALIKRMTDIPVERVKSILAFFEEDRKAFYYKRYIIIANRVKYNSDSPKITSGVIKIIRSLPKTVVKYLYSLPDTAIYEFVIENIGKNHDRVSDAEKDTLSDAESDTLSDVENDTLSDAEKDRVSDSILFNSILSNFILSHSIETEGWTDSFRKIFEQIFESYKMSLAELKTIAKIAKTKQGRNEITNIYTHIETSEKILDKRAYFLSSIIKNRKKEQ
jgi:hypothetical protein